MGVRLELGVDRLQSTRPDELGKCHPARMCGLGQLVTLVRQEAEGDQGGALSGLRSRPCRTWPCHCAAHGAPFRSCFRLPRNSIMKTHAAV